MAPLSIHGLTGHDHTALKHGCCTPASRCTAEPWPQARRPGAELERRGRGFAGAGQGSGVAAGGVADHYTRAQVDTLCHGRLRSRSSRPGTFGLIRHLSQ